MEIKTWTQKKTKLGKPPSEACAPHGPWTRPRGHRQQWAPADPCAPPAGCGPYSGFGIAASKPTRPASTADASSSVRRLPPQRSRCSSQCPGQRRSLRKSCPVPGSRSNLPPPACDLCFGFDKVPLPLTSTCLELALPLTSTWLEVPPSRSGSRLPGIAEPLGPRTGRTRRYCCIPRYAPQPRKSRRGGATPPSWYPGGSKGAPGNRSGAPRTGHCCQRPR